MKDEKSLKKLLRDIKLKPDLYEYNKNKINKYLENFQKNEFAEVEKELIFKKECYQSEKEPLCRMLTFLSIVLAFIGIVFKDLYKWIQILICLMFFLCILLVIYQYFKIIIFEQKAQKIELILNQINDKKNKIKED